ncbi:hypothetical protein AAFF_G00356880 [Aldrovandia affinis]|uniref:Uncharacterized protein n=1 Tax=Aldrovandia affinis TaxID=143900 RepID=A0AAD7X144_9TELE|nr:hypothetical protein AAFF_G00356880 [Aldrovandia affinis]
MHHRHHAYEAKQGMTRGTMDWGLRENGAAVRRDLWKRALFQRAARRGDAAERAGRDGIPGAHRRTRSNNNSALVTLGGNPTTRVSGGIPFPRRGAGAWRLLGLGMCGDWAGAADAVWTLTGLRTTAVQDVEGRVDFLWLFDPDIVTASLGGTEMVTNFLLLGNSQDLGKPVRLTLFLC